MSIKYDIGLLEKLWSKHSYKTKQGIRSNRARVLNEYKEITGTNIPMGTLDGYVLLFDKEKLFADNHTLNFNERTDNIIDEKHELLTPNDLMESMGLDPEFFELSPNNTINRWWSDIPSETLQRIRNGQIKLGFRAKEQEFSLQNIKELFDSMDFKPYPLTYTSDRGGKGLLEIGLSDLHFDGDRSYDKQRDKLRAWVNSKEWEEILILVGGDLFNTNDSDGKTVAGTKVDNDMDITKMLKDAMDFYQPLLLDAMNSADRVKCVYIEGNHDKDLCLSFAFTLSLLFPDIEFDLEAKPFKCHTYYDVFIGLLHGDKPRNKAGLSKLFFQLFKEEIAKATVVEIHGQHLHHEKSKDDMGFMIRTLSSAVPTDKWSYDNGFVGTNKRMQSFIFNESSLEAIVYV